MTRAGELLQRFRRDRSAIAAVEFALVLPFLMTMWLGMEQFSEYMTADAKTLMAAQSVSDLIAQIAPAQTNAYPDIANAATQIFAPLPTSGTLTVDVVGVAYDNSNNPTMTGGWECPSSGSSTGPAPDSPVPMNLAAGLGSQGQMTIMVNIKYNFNPAMTFNFLGPAIVAALGTQIISERAFSRPRLSALLAKPCT